jgi:hypothetical protein
MVDSADLFVQMKSVSHGKPVPESFPRLSSMTDLALTPFSSSLRRLQNRHPSPALHGSPEKDDSE